MLRSGGDNRCTGIHGGRAGRDGGENNAGQGNHHARKQGASYLFYTKEEAKRVDQLLRLTRNTDDCKAVKFDFNHEHLKIEDTAPADKFQIKAYF